MSVDLSQLSDEEVLALYRKLRKQQPVGLVDSIKDSPIGGFVRGLRDPIDAVAPMLTRALPDSVVAAGDAIGNHLADWGLPVERTNHARQLSDIVTGQRGATVDDINRRAELDYQQNWRRGENDGIDTGRIAGNIAATIPLAARLPLSAATLPGRIAQGAGMGAGLGMLQPVDTSSTEDSFAEQKAKQAALGAVFGAAGVPVGELAAKGIGHLVQGVKGLRNRADLAINGNITVKVDHALQQAGVDVGALAPAVRESLRKDVAAALKSGQEVSPEALARIADARTVGVTLLRGQASRDPAQFAFEQNTRGIVGAGEPLQQRLAQQNEQLLGAANQGASSLSPYQAGSRFTDALSSTNQAARGVIDDAYTAARAKAGTSAEVPGQLLAQRAGEVLETFGPENVPGPVLRRLQSYGFLGTQQTRSFTVGEADRLRKVINANFDPTKRAEAAALNSLRSGIDDAENALAEGGAAIGEEAAQAFAKARHLARNHFQLLERVDALRAAAEGVDPDRFVMQHIVKASVGQVRGLRDVLKATGDPSLVDEMRGQVLAHLKTKATGGAADEFAKFSQSAFRRAMNEVGDEKLALLFGPKEYARIAALGRTASTVQVPPAGAAVNTSNTASAFMNLLARTPYTNVAVRPLQSSITDMRVSAALQPSAGMGSEPASELMRRLLKQGGLLGATAGGSLGGSLGTF